VSASASSRAKVDGFVPGTQHVNLRIAREQLVLLRRWVVLPLVCFCFFTIMPSEGGDAFSMVPFS